MANKGRHIMAVSTRPPIESLGLETVKEEVTEKALSGSSAADFWLQDCQRLH